jgi:hypothetical protein
LQELKQVVDDPLLADLDFVWFVEQRCVTKGFEAFLSSLHIAGVGEEFSEAEDTLLFLEIVLHMQDNIGQHGKGLALKFT